MDMDNQGVLNQVNQMSVERDEHGGSDSLPDNIVGVVMEDEFITTGAVEEVVMEREDEEYDAYMTNQFEQNLVFELYQPIETEYGLICKICLQLGKQIEFGDRVQYASHRYKVHGTYNNCVICPYTSCKEVYASMVILRKHLLAHHKLPLEIHHQLFPNMAEFERWRHLVELASNCRFMMHTKQASYKRQVMHCSRSEHKMILQSKKHRLPRLRMQKEGACCPAFISFRMDEKSGQVQAFFQLVHIGHATLGDMDGDALELQSSVFTVDATGSGRLPALHFPEKPIYLGDRAMQFVQIDVIDMKNSVYSTVVYGKILVITDLHTGYMWAKPLPDVVRKLLIMQILTDIFCQFGVPDGFSCSASQAQGIVRDVMNSLNDVFRVEIREFFNEMPEYDAFRNMLLEQSSVELKNVHRWVEMLQFAVMNINQSGNKSAFERMFNRKPPGDIAWGDGLDDSESGLEDFAPITARYHVGDRVYLRNLDSRPGRGNSIPYLYGLIGEVDWEGSPHFPYRIYYSKSSEPWPTENCISTWVSPFDVLPTTHDLMLIRDEDRRRVMSTLLCSCHGDNDESSCNLFRSHACAKGMSRSCCAESEGECPYHEAVSGEESYPKLEMLSCYYSKNCPPAERRRIGVLLRARVPNLKEPVMFTDDNASDCPSTSTGDNLVVAAEYELNSTGTTTSPPPPRLEAPAIMRRRRLAKSASRIIVHTTGNPSSNDGESPASRQSPPAEDSPAQNPPDTPQEATSTKRKADPEIKEPVPAKRVPGGEKMETPDEDVTIVNKTVAADQPTQTRRSGRNPKAKTFEDYVPI